MRFCCFYFPLFLFKLDFMLNIIEFVISSMYSVSLVVLSTVAEKSGRAGGSQEWSPNPNSLHNLQRRRLVVIYYVYRIDETFDLSKWRLQFLDINQRSPTRLALHTSTILVKKRDKRLFWKKKILKISLEQKKKPRRQLPWRVT